MKPAAFAYIAPRKVAEAHKILAQYGADARIIAGGQTLSPMLNMRIVSPAVLLDINRIDDWGTVKSVAEKSAITHALVRQRQGLDGDAGLSAVPLIAMTMPYVGHFQTRNRGTICGSIAHADPTAELPLLLKLLGGTVHLTSNRRRRTVAAADFFLGPLTTDRQPDELLVAVEWPILSDGTQFAFRKVGVHRAHSALCSAAVALRLNDLGLVSELRVGLTAVSDRPVLLNTKPFLNSIPNAGWRQAVADATRVDLSFISDLHASAQYRGHVAGTLVDRCLIDILEPSERMA